MTKSIAQKHCPKCNENKAVSEFYYSKHTKKGFRVYCKMCERNERIVHCGEMREYNKNYYLLHEEEARQYRIKNRKHQQEWNRKFYLDHHEQMLVRAKEYRTTHSAEGRSEYNKKYYATHREEAKRAVKEYRAAHPEWTIECNQRRRARKMCADGNGIMAEQWRNLKEEYNHLCAYCNQKKPLAMDHIIPLSRSGRHDIDNIVPACRSCNSSKGDLSLLVFLQRRKLIC